MKHKPRPAKDFLDNAQGLKFSVSSSSRFPFRFLLERVPFSCKWKVHFELTAAAALGVALALAALHQPKPSPATPASAPPSGSTYYSFLLKNVFAFVSLFLLIFCQF